MEALYFAGTLFEEYFFILSLPLMYFLAFEFGMHGEEMLGVTILPLHLPSGPLSLGALGHDPFM